MGDPVPAIRVGDRERRVVDDQLQDAVGDGVLTLTEYEERSTQLWRAQTRADLEVLTADLPTYQPSAGQGPAAQPVRRRRRVVAVMSEDRFDAPVRPDEAVGAYAVMGSAKLDLRRADLPDGVHVDVRSVMGEVDVWVPDGADVQMTGASIMGERKLELPAGGSGPLVYLNAVAIMGSVRVRSGPVAPASSGDPRPARVRDTPPTSRQVATRGRELLRKAGGVIGSVALPVAVVGGLLLAGPDGTAIFGSRTVQAGPGDDVQVSVLFGSVDVAVPDDARVDQSGLTIFGSVDCKTACSKPASGNDIVSVRSVGGFGSVTIKTESEARRGGGS